VRAKIAAVLANEISVEDFARWIMSNSWNMHRDSSAESVELVSSIHLLLAERDESIYSDDDFRKEIRALLKPNGIRINVTISFDRVVPIDLDEPVASANLKHFREVLIPLRS